jgi:hypothetical protein
MVRVPLVKVIQQQARARAGIGQGILLTLFERWFGPKARKKQWGSAARQESYSVGIGLARTGGVGLSYQRVAVLRHARRYTAALASRVSRASTPPASREGNSLAVGVPMCSGILTARQLGEACCSSPCRSRSRHPRASGEGWPQAPPAAGPGPVPSCPGVPHRAQVGAPPAGRPSGKATSGRRDAGTDETCASPTAPPRSLNSPHAPSPETGRPHLGAAMRDGSSSGWAMSR